ncbi:MAG: glycerophosphodiester phosphodiesterase [Limnochordia bacterium]|jgi:glycerophosphoryl diester phosphodiesterase
MSMAWAILLSLVIVAALSRQVTAAYGDGERIFYLQAHRGYSGRFPENTLLAYKEAVAAKADVIELDVRLSADGVAFVMHDENLERTTNGCGPIAATAAAQIKELDAGSWFDPRFAGERVPTLAEALEFCRGQVRVNIELKTRRLDDAMMRRTVEETARVIDQCDMWDQVLLSSFHFPALAYAGAIRPQATTALLDWDVERTVDRQLDVLKIGGKGWFIHPKMVTSEKVALAHERGLMVTCGAGNNPAGREESVQLLIDAGVDVISTNFPYEVAAILERQGLRRL